MFMVLDVSRWQGRIDWDTVKASGRVHGVMLRALGSRSGTPYIDPMFETNYSACIRLGIPVGVYYYSCAVTAPQRDAELALLHDALRGKRLQLPAAIDVEDARLRALTPDALSALVAGAARQLEHWGLYAMVYTYTHFADTALHMDTLAPFDLWLADYRGKRPARRHGMWQYTSRGRVSGISGPVDLSRTEKDYPALLHRAGLDRTIL
ncbi:GH25 family lysozyme [Faecalibacterium prausnitzii]|uniref:GH25 family lysozyme n=1 Tax=Faecalibacterium prausnitzii TaxID=853 RepID=UPI0012DDCE0F|nr:GH25 family lysozyme [Faecalibacterium prausnitzii]